MMLGPNTNINFLVFFRFRNDITFFKNSTVVIVIFIRVQYPNRHFLSDTVTKAGRSKKIAFRSLRTEHLSAGSTNPFSFCSNETHYNIITKLFK